MPEPAARRTGVVYDERCAAHLNPPGGMPFGAQPEWSTARAFECPQRLSLTREVLVGSGVLDHVRELPARHATADELRLAHTGGHVERILAAARAGTPVQVGHEAWTVPGSLEPALLAAGGLLTAVGAVLRDELDNALALLRPPGHHAESDAAMGFCLFNNVAIAARWAQREHGLERVAILDWDVHHGNGTEEIFYADGSVLCVSLHQQDLYPPRSGQLEDRGRGAGTGRNLNVPLPASTGDDGYALAFEQVVEPALRAFAPELLLIGAGQDAAASDPLGRMSMTVPGYRALTERAVALADELCAGRVVATLEGGYSLEHLPLANLAILEGLAGRAPTFTADPVGCDVPAAISDMTRAAVAAAVTVHAPALAS